MSIVINQSGEEIAFEIAEAYMSPTLRLRLRRERPDLKTNQDFFSAYEKLHQEVFQKPWSLSSANPLYA